MEEEARRQAEEEARRKAEEEVRKKAGEEQRRLEEDRQVYAERKRLAEEKAKAKALKGKARQMEKVAEKKKVRKRTRGPSGDQVALSELAARVAARVGETSTAGAKRTKTAVTAVTADEGVDSTEDGEYDTETAARDQAAMEDTSDGDEGSRKLARARGRIRFGGNNPCYRCQQKGEKCVISSG